MNIYQKPNQRKEGKDRIIFPLIMYNDVLYTRWRPPLGGCHHLSCGLNKPTCSRSASRIWPTLGIDPRSQNPHPTFIAIRPRTHAYKRYPNKIPVITFATKKTESHLHIRRRVLHQVDAGIFLLIFYH